MYKNKIFDQVSRRKSSEQTKEGTKILKVAPCGVGAWLNGHDRHTDRQMGGERVLRAVETAREKQLAEGRRGI